MTFHASPTLDPPVEHCDECNAGPHDEHDRDCGRVEAEQLAAYVQAHEDAAIAPYRTALEQLLRALRADNRAIGAGVRLAMREAERVTGWDALSDPCLGWDATEERG